MLPRPLLGKAKAQIPWLRVFVEGVVIVNIVIEQEGVPVRRITQRQKRDEALGLTHRIAIPVPAIG